MAMVRTLLTGRAATSEGGNAMQWMGMFSRTSNDDTTPKKTTVFSANGKRKNRDRLPTSVINTPVETSRAATKFDQGLGVGLATKAFQKVSSPDGAKVPSSVDIDRDIMHRHVDASLLVYVVKKDASAEDIGSAFDVPPEFVYSRWHQDDEKNSLSIKKMASPERHAFLSKPCDAEEVEAALRKALRKVCGFSAAKSHPDMNISGSNRLVSKSGRARCAGAICSRALPLASLKPVYFEYVFMTMDPVEDEYPETRVGITASVPSRSRPSMLGSSGNSVGFSCAGDIIKDMMSMKSSTECDVGDVIGVLVDQERGDVYTELKVDFFLNGRRVSKEPTWMIVRLDQTVYAGVSMTGQGTTMMQRCCPDEVVLPSCAPEGTISLCGRPSEH